MKVSSEFCKIQISARCYISLKQLTLKYCIKKQVITETVQFTEYKTCNAQWVTLHSHDVSLWYFWCSLYICLTSLSCKVGGRGERVDREMHPMQYRVENIREWSVKVKKVKYEWSHWPKSPFWSYLYKLVLCLECIVSFCCWLVGFLVFLSFHFFFFLLFNCACAEPKP